MLALVGRLRQRHGAIVDQIADIIAYRTPLELGRHEIADKQHTGQKSRPVLR